MSRSSRDWNYHGSVSEHQIPDYRRQAAVASSRGVASSRESSRSASRLEGDGSALSSASSSRHQHGLPPQGPPAAGPAPQLPRPLSPTTTRPPLSDSQAALYTALFGVQPPSRSAPSSPSSRAPATPATPEAAGDGPSLPGNEQAIQIERAVRKAMRGAAMERQRAVDAAVGAAEDRVGAA